MAQVCCMCRLQENDNYKPSTSIIIEALQQVVKSLVKKDSQDQLLLQEKEDNISVRKEEIAALTAENNKLKQEIKQLNTTLSFARNRSDHYKNKFLGAQDSLVELHNKNKELSKKCSKPEQSKEENIKKSYPFKVVKVTSKNPKVILAPDTCCPQGQEREWMENEDPEEEENYNSGDESVFAKPATPAKSHNAKHAIETRHCTVDLVNCSVDPDETCLQGHLLSDGRPHSDTEEEDFSIPPSPVLSGSVLATKWPLNVQESQLHTETPIIDKNAHDLEVSMQDGNRSDADSPSLLKTRKMLEKQKPPRSMDSTALPPTSGNLQESQLDFHNGTLKDSLLYHRKPVKKSISPIKFPKEVDGHTSIDELFEKTDGELKSFLDDDVVSKTHDLDETNLCNVTDEVLVAEKQNESIVISDDDDDDNEGMSDLDDFTVSTPRQPPKRKKCSIASTSKQSENDSFNIVPRKGKDLGFKYQSVVRKRADREKLNAKSCPQCEAYYSDLPPDERERALKEICRHRHEFAPPSSPEHFWEIGIPNTAECRRRGYLVDETDLTPQGRAEVNSRRRRKKPLQARFNKKL